MKKIFTILSISVLTLVIDLGTQAEFAYAANPTASTIRHTLKNPRKKRITVLVKHTFAEAIEMGGTCEVSFQACISRFVPKGFSGGNNRSCAPQDIGSVTLSQGAQIYRFRSRSKIVNRARRAGRQLNVRTSSVCTDSESTTETIISNGRARKVSGSASERGVSPTKFITALIKNLS